MKKTMILLTLILMTGCISTNTKGHIKTKNNKVVKFEKAYLITWSKEIWIIEPQQETGFYKRDIKEIHIETDNYR